MAHARKDASEALEERTWDDMGSVAEVEEALKKTQATAAQLETRIIDFIQPSLVKVRSRVAELEHQRDSLKAKLLACSGGAQDMADQLRKISRRELTEIKQFTKNPPDAVRRTLVAAWLILNGDRFAGSNSVTFDEVRDWHRCQRMLAEGSFIEKILRFEVQALDDLPQVVAFVAERFFGMPVEMGHSHRRSSRAGSLAEDAPSQPETPQRSFSGPAGSATLLPTLATSSTAGHEARGSKRGATMAAFGSDARVDRRSLTTSGAGTPGRSNSKDASGQPKVILDEQTVANASKPMAMMVRWMIELIRGHVDRGCLRHTLLAVEDELAEARAQLAQLECDGSAAQAELAKVRAEATRLAAWLAQLRQSQRAAEKALQDMKRLEALTATQEQVTPQRGKAKGARTLLFPAEDAALGAAAEAALRRPSKGGGSSSSSPSGVGRSRAAREGRPEGVASRLASLATLAFGGGEACATPRFAEEDLDEQLGPLRRQVSNGAIGSRPGSRAGSRTMPDGPSALHEGDRSAPSPTLCRAAMRPKRVRTDGLRLVKTGTMAKLERFDGRDGVLSMALPLPCK